MKVNHLGSVRLETDAAGTLRSATEQPVTQCGYVTWVILPAPS